jgi:hypothetical protein
MSDFNPKRILRQMRWEKNCPLLYNKTTTFTPMVRPPLQGASGASGTGPPPRAEALGCFLGPAISGPTKPIDCRGYQLPARSLITVHSCPLVHFDRFFVKKARDLHLNPRNFIAPAFLTDTRRQELLLGTWISEKRGQRSEIYNATRTKEFPASFGRTLG